MSAYNRCSECNGWVPKGDSQCPHCGARVDLKSKLKKVWRGLFPGKRTGQRQAVSRLCVKCNRLIGPEDETCSHCGANQGGVNRVIRAVSVGMPGKLSVTSVLLGLYVLLQVLPIAVFPNVVKTAGEYVTQGDSNRYLLLHENDKNIYGLDMTGKRRFPVAPGLFIVDTHILMGANHGPLLEQGQYWRLITATFLHLGLMHLLFNGYALFVLGRPTEGLYGWGWFLGLYLASGIGGNLVSWAAGVFDYPNLQLGASGAIFGLIGVGIVHCWRHRWVNRALLNTLLLWGGLSLAMGFFIGADNWAHVGGLLTGAGLAWLLPAERVTRREYTKLGNTVGMVSALLILISVGFAAASAVELVAVIP